MHRLYVKEDITVSWDTGKILRCAQNDKVSS